MAITLETIILAVVCGFILLGLLILLTIISIIKNIRDIKRQKQEKEERFKKKPQYFEGTLQ